MSTVLDSRPARADMSNLRRFLSVPRVIVALGVVLALLLALPGQTVTTKYVNDLFIFLDGAYRIVEGQVPNRDFHSSLGPLAFYLPAIGYGLTGSLGAAMPVGLALVVVLLSVIGAHLIGTRMPAAIGLPLAGFLLVAATAPLNPGEGIADLSFAMFYNRIGWAALGLLFVLYLTPVRPHRWQTGLDAASATALTLLLVYMKASYGLVALGFLLFMLTDRQQRLAVALALATCGVSAVLVELVWRGSLTYVADLQLAADVSGDLPDLQRLVTIVLQNLADIAVYLIFAAALLISRRRCRDWLFAGFCLGAGILIIEQNFQAVGILTLTAGAAVMAVRLSEKPRTSAVAWGLPLLLAILMLPVAVQYSLTLLLHTGLAITRQAEPMPMPGFEAVHLARLSNDGLFQNFSRYNRSLADGAAALVQMEPERVVVFDFVGPFTAGLALPPARGDYPWYHWGRTLDDTVYPPADEILADAQVIMEPKAPIEFWTAAGMRRIYAPYLDANFRLVRETADWRIYARRPGSSGPLANTSVTRQRTSAQP